MVFAVSTSFASLVVLVHGERYGGNNEKWNAIYSSFTCVSIWSIRSCRLSSSSTGSLITIFPLSTAEHLLNLGEARTGPIFCLFFLGRGVRGDLETSRNWEGSSWFNYISLVCRAWVLAIVLMECLVAAYLLFFVSSKCQKSSTSHTLWALKKYFPPVCSSSWKSLRISSGTFTLMSHHPLLFDMNWLARHDPCG